MEAESKKHTAPTKHTLKYQATVTRELSLDDPRDFEDANRGLIGKAERVMVKDENVCLHCGLCAERCPTGAWDMQRFLYSVTKAG